MRMIINFKKASLPLMILALGAAPMAHAADAEPRLLVHILDYVAKDYPGAVKDGKILNASEYQEQTEFVENALKMARAVPAAAKPENLEADVAQLRKLVIAKAAPEKIAELSGQIRAKLVQTAHIEALPRKKPDFTQGSKLFAQNCVACHGPTGRGDGPAGAHLDPKPANLADHDGMRTMGPLQVFNTVRLGVSGTAMAPFKNLSDEDTWNISYFVLSLSGNTPSDPPQPPSMGEGGTSAAIHTARTKLDSAEKEFQAGHFAEARNEALSAYLEGFELVEPALQAKNPKLLRDVEDRMMSVRQKIEARGSAQEVSFVVSEAKEGLDEASQALSSASESPWVLFSAAAVVILREGFEAALLIIAFLGVLRASGNTRAARWVHLGWVSALVLGVAAWFLSGWLVGITGAQRELMEGFTSFFAVGVLLFVGIWLHRQTEIKRWKEFIDSRVHQALETKNLFGLTTISFVAVFREALETVLFLRTLWIGSGPESHMAMVSGLCAALVGVLALSWAILHYSARVPIRKIFSYSSALMVALAVILVGKGLHSLQEAGWVPSTPTFWPLRLELLGFYPTLETFAGQLVLVAALAAGWALSLRFSSTEPERP